MIHLEEQIGEKKGKIKEVKGINKNQIKYYLFI